MSPTGEDNVTLESTRIPKRAETLIKSMIEIKQGQAALRIEELVVMHHLSVVVGVDRIFRR